MARLQRVFIDTSELFPFTIMDVLLTLSEDFLFAWVWTDELLDEWEHVIVREGVRTPDSARSVTDAVRTHFGRYRIASDLYRSKATADLSPDPGDRLHAAACIHGNVDVLLTRNIRDFRAPAIAHAGVQVMTSDAFLCDLLTHRRQQVVESFTRAADAKKSPPTTPAELADSISNAGAPSFAERIRRLDSTASPRTSRATRRHRSP